jgi:hypothetical protein
MAVMVYGSMGGDGQPQTQAALFTRYVMQNVAAAGEHHPPALAAGAHLGTNLRHAKAGGPSAPNASPACVSWVTTLKCWPILAKPWATPGRLFATQRPV